jgi:hypothetical protein
MERGSMTIQQRIDRIAQQAVTLNTPPASTPLWQTDVEFGRNNSMAIWNRVFEARHAESKPPVPRNNPHPTPLPRREPDRDLPDDSDDDATPEPSDDEDDGDADACACECGPCRAGDCEHCNDPACDDPNCEHGNSNDDDFDE